MAQQVGKRVRWFVLSLGIGLIISGASMAQTQTAKHGGTAVPAIVGDSSTTGDSDSATGADAVGLSTEKLLFVFLVICGLIYLTYFGLKRYISWSRDNTNKRRAVGVIDTIPLGGKRFVTVARVYDRVLVLGVGENNISLLTELTEDGMTTPTPPAERSKTTETFLNLINSMTKKGRQNARETQPAVMAAEGQGSIL